MCNIISERKDNCVCTSIHFNTTFKKLAYCIRWLTFSVKLYPEISSEYLDSMHHFVMYPFKKILICASKELEGRSINYHKRDIKINHTEL